MDDFAMTASSLCDQCQRLDRNDFFANLQRGIPDDGEAVLSLGRFPKDIAAVQCDLCRFFSQFAVQYKRKHLQHVRLFRHLIQVDAPNPSNPEFSPFFSVIRENSRLRHDWRIKNEIIQNGVCIYRPIDEPTPGFPRQIEAARIDYEFLASFLSDCKSHAPCNQIPQTPNSLTYIRLIDCYDQCLVVCQPRSNPYCCLSYVWGTHSRDESSSLSSNQIEGNRMDFPLTIQDAMRVVSELGYRFLWVDRYCIDQKDPEEKALMLRNMDQIYESADLTLVNLHGDNDEAGLPGVSRVARKKQPSFTIGRGSLVFSWPSISTIIKSSVWATRGWTYQEARLSRRCLFFSEEQTYFVCRESTRSETMPLGRGKSWITDALNDENLISFHNLFGGSGSLGDPLLDDRLMFTQRSLTYESDVLDAFRGILARAPDHTIWGVPIYTVYDKLKASRGFALGLAWSKKPSHLDEKHILATPRKQSRRRDGFPTWSWSSVTGEIYFIGGHLLHKAFEDGRVDDANEANIQMYIYILESWLSIQEWLQSHPAVVLPETLDTKVLQVKGDITQVQLFIHEGDKVRAFVHTGGGFGRTPLNVLYDIDSDKEKLFSGADAVDNFKKRSRTQDALIIIRGRVPQSPPSTRARIVLMLLEWVGTNLAERRGIVSSYNLGVSIDFAASISVTTKTFILQ